jgi:putative ABC transport system permease protein
MDTFIHDLRYGWRMLVKNPGFTVVILLMLALGIGANTAVFTIFDATLLRPLPFEQPQNLVQIWETRTSATSQQMEASYPDYVDIRDRNQVFSRVGGYSATTVTLASKEGAEQVFAGVATSEFFETLGVHPILGRSFQPADDQEHTPSSTILAYGAWQRRFAGDRNIVGKTFVINGEPSTIVGVLPKSFQFAPTRSADFWISTRVGGWRLRRNAHWLHPVARLKSGMTLEQAQAGMATLARQLQQQYPDTNSTVGVQIVSLKEDLVGSMRPALLILLAAVAFVLLITCANVAGLLLARSLSRQREISVRMALGAARMRIVRQLLTESVLLSLIGGTVGVLTASWAVRAIVSVIPEQQLLSLPSLQGLSLNAPVLLFSFGLSVLTGILFGLVPALQTFRADVQHGLQEGGRASVGGGHSRLRNTFVVVEVSLAVVLLIGAGLLLKSLQKVLSVDPGFRTENLLTASVALPQNAYPDDEHRLAFHNQLLEAAATLPGVKNAATVNIVPLSSSGNTSRFDIEGHPKAGGGEEYEANSRSISPNYFPVMGIPLQKGRFFGSQDTPTSTHVVIVNQALVKQVFPHDDPIGKRINYTYTGKPNLWEIVGVVGDENVGRLDEKPTPVAYTSLAQEPDSYFSLAVRTTRDPLPLSKALRETIHQIDPSVPVFDVATMSQIISDSPTMLLRAYPAYLIGGFAILALLLAALGIYGLLSYSVTERTRELGLRMALGAKQADLLRLVVGNGIKLTTIGIAVGILGGFAVARLIASLLFGVGPTDLPTFFGVAALIIVAASFASYLPARRAARIDPMVALRWE